MFAYIMQAMKKAVRRIEVTSSIAQARAVKRSQTNRYDMSQDRQPAGITAIGESFLTDEQKRFFLEHGWLRIPNGE
jgi:hypothetical protein